MAVFTIWLPHPWERSQVPIDRRLDGSESRCGHLGEEKDFLSIPEFEPRTVQPVPIDFTDNAISNPIIIGFVSKRRLYREDFSFK